MKIILFGPQGAGKGVIGALISEKYNLTVLGTGQILRDAIKAGSGLGKVAEEYINAGNMVPDDIITNVVKEKIAEMNGYILDGFPRTLHQAELFEEEMKNIDFIFAMEAPEELLLHRLSGRRLCKECGAVYNIFPDCDPNPKEEGKCDKCGGELYQRKDDTEEFIKKRLQDYREKTEPIVEKYKDKAIKIDATGNPEQILGRIVSVIEKENQ